MEPITSEESALYEYVARTSQGLETVLRIPQQVSTALIALALAAAVVGAWLGVRRLLALFSGWQNARRIDAAISEHRAAISRREAYAHARLRTPEERGLKPAPPAADDDPVAPAEAVPPAFAPRPPRQTERLLLGALATLIILSAIITLLFCVA